MAVSRLAEIYARSVLDGKRKIKDVPAPWRAEAQKILKKLEETASTNNGGE